MSAILSFDDFLSQHAAVFAFHPFWALIPAAIAGVFYMWLRTPWSLSAAAVWIAYIPCEISVRAGLFCTADCSPREALLPVLGVVMAITLLACREILIVALRKAWVWKEDQPRTIADPRSSATAETPKSFQQIKQADMM